MWTSLIFIAYSIVTFQFVFWIPYKSLSVGMNWPSMMGNQCFQKVVSLWKNHLLTFPPNAYIKKELGFDWNAQIGAHGALAFIIGLMAFFPRPWVKVSSVLMILYTLFNMSAVLYVYDQAGVFPQTCFAQNKTLDKVVTVFGFLLVAQAALVVAFKNVPVCRAIKQCYDFFNGPDGLFKCQMGKNSGCTVLGCKSVSSILVLSVVLVDLAFIVHFGLSMLTQDTLPVTVVKGKGGKF